MENGAATARLPAPDTDALMSLVPFSNPATEKLKEVASAETDRLLVVVLAGVKRHPSYLAILFCM